MAGTTTSCGCLRKELCAERGRAKLKDMTGKTFGRLTVVEPVYDPKQGQRVWKCQCVCGNITQVAGGSLRQRHTTSCGCYGKERAAERYRELFSLPPGVAALNDLFARYKRQARTRGLVFKLSKAGFQALVVQDCHYCGDSPTQVVQARYGRNGGITYNGVDRQDNDLGYVEGNVVPCCGTCNRAKSQATVSEFIAWARRVAAGSGGLDA
jgi:hypothetical protein